MLMKVKTDVVGGLWIGGEVREFWIDVPDSDEDSDYDDDDDDETYVRRGPIRYLNPSPHGYGAPDTIYPGPDHQHYTYRHDYLRDFSRKAINQYNHQTIDMLMKVKTDVVGGLWIGGEVREFWIDVPDSDEDSDYDDDDDDETYVRRGAIRYLNPPPHGYVSKTILGGRDTIHPGPDHQHYTYRHDHLRDFSRKAINQYNHQTGNTYEFVELVEASVGTAVESDYVVVTFEARQSDDTKVTTSFRAETHVSASESLIGSYDIETVVPLHSDDSDMI